MVEIAVALEQAEALEVVVEESRHCGASRDCAAAARSIRRCRNGSASRRNRAVRAGSHREAVAAFSPKKNMRGQRRHAEFDVLLRGNSVADDLDRGLDAGIDDRNGRRRSRRLSIEAHKSSPVGVRPRASRSRIRGRTREFLVARRRCRPPGARRHAVALVACRGSGNSWRRERRSPRRTLSA